MGKAARLSIYWLDAACRLVIPLRQVALAQLNKYHHQSGNAASGKLVWNQHETYWSNDYVTVSFVWILNSLMTFILPGYYRLICLFTEIWFSFIVDLPLDICIAWKNIRTIIVDIWPAKPLLYTSIYEYEYKLINVSLTIYVLICNVVRNPFFCSGNFSFWESTP